MRCTLWLALRVFGAVSLLGNAIPLAAAPEAPDHAVTEPDTAGQTLYALGSIGDLYRISPYSAGPDRFLITNGLYYRALAIDPTTLRAYAISWSHSSSQTDDVLYEINLTTGGHIRQIGQVFPSEPLAMAFDGQGQAYMVGNLDQNLYRLDKTTAALTTVGNTGYYLFALTYDSDGTLYGSVGVGPGRGSLVWIDPRTGAATLRGNPGVMGGLAIDTDGTLYGSSNSDLYRIDKNNGQATLIGRVGISGVNNLAFLKAPSSPGGGVPAADFTWSPASPIAGQPVQFTDQSTGGPTSWFWNLDGVGGEDSSLRNPTWTYAASGTYNVTLRACNAAGCNSRTRPVTINNSAAGVIHINGPTNLASLALAQFTASATGCNPTRFAWQWTTPDADLGFSAGSLGEPASVVRGWSAQGTHTIQVSNPGCPGVPPGQATIVVGPPGVEQTTLRPSASNSTPIPLDGPTVVFCHGMESTGAKGNQLWSCIHDGGLFCDANEVDHPVDDLLPSDSQGLGIHGLQFTWSGAFQFPDYVRAWAFVGDAATQLVEKLEKRLLPAYRGPIQFVGHSLGSAVCALAAKRLLEIRPSIQKLQVTALDRPDHISKFGVPGKFNFDSHWMAETFSQSPRPGLDLVIDNYWSTTGTGVGDQMSCVAGARTYNHGPLLQPGAQLANLFGHESHVDHSGVQQWYRWTMDPNMISNPAVCSGVIPNLPAGVNASLNPCAAGWSFSVVRGSSFPNSPSCDPISVSNPAMNGWCASAGGVSTPCQGSAGVSANDRQMSVEVPAFARALTFDMTVSRPDSSTSAVVLLDTFPLWIGSLGAFLPNQPVEVGPFPIDGLTGPRRLSVKVVGGDSGVVVKNFRAQKVLQPCQSESTLCVASNRFRVEADWIDHAGNSGHASPRYVSADESGFMWFFQPANLELIVKVLNACSLSSHPRFWVFAAGLTDVGVRLKVTDTQTGAVKIYESSEGDAFQPIQDTDAFATCTSADTESSLLHAEESVAPKRVDVEANATDKGLRNGRFDVRATWKTADGASGEGHFTSVTDETGYIWFFGPNNIEVAVKVIDGCALNNRYWVFAAGLTNVQVDLTVTDTRTGTTTSYRNPLNQSFQPIQDTNALATCP